MSNQLFCVWNQDGDAARSLCDVTPLTSPVSHHQPVSNTLAEQSIWTADGWISSVFGL